MGEGCLLSKKWIQFWVQEFLIFCCAEPSEWYRYDIGMISGRFFLSKIQGIVYTKIFFVAVGWGEYDKCVIWFCWIFGSMGHD